MAANSAFVAPLALGGKSSLLPPHSPEARAPSALTPRVAAASRRSGAAVMVVDRVADKFMHTSQTREAKAAATPFGVYTVQCTEASAGANVAEATRLAALAANYRLRQSSAQAKTADLFETRRAAIVNAHGSHTDESYAVRFPARAAASVLGRAEKLRACSRYFPTAAGSDAELMFQCVERQFKAKKVVGGVYTTACADGRVSGDADTARVAALATEYRAGLLPEGVKQQMRYDSVREAVALARGGCSYEEAYFTAYPKMAAAMRYSTGAYATTVTETQLLTGIKKTDVAAIIKGDNLAAVWPGFEIREATPRARAPWAAPAVKDYSPMSQAAVEFGLKGRVESDEANKYEVDKWVPGWQPKSVLMSS